jgi:hypothetical protein
LALVFNEKLFLALGKKKIGHPDLIGRFPLKKINQDPV